MNSKKLHSNLMLLLTAFIWGVSFVAQSVGMEYVGPFTFNSVRNFIGAFVLLLFIPLIDKTNRTSASTDPASDPAANVSSSNRQTLIIGGILCGICLAVASSFQQIGIAYTSVGKAGIYHCHVHCHRPNPRTVSRQKSPRSGLDQCRPFRCGIISFMYDRQYRTE